MIIFVIPMMVVSASLYVGLIYPYYLIAQIIEHFIRALITFPNAVNPRNNWDKLWYLQDYPSALVSTILREWSNALEGSTSSADFGAVLKYLKLLLRCLITCKCKNKKIIEAAFTLAKPRFMKDTKALEFDAHVESLFI